MYDSEVGIVKYCSKNRKDFPDLSSFQDPAASIVAIRFVAAE
jgi:hypothetical protein